MVLSHWALLLNPVSPMLTPHGHFEALLHSHAVLGFIRANMGGAIAAVGLAWGLTGCSSQRLPSTHGEQPEKCTHYPGLGAGRAGTQTQTVTSPSALCF